MSADLSSDKWLLREEAADILGVRPKTIMALYTHEGVFTVRERFGDTWLFLRSEVMQRKAHPRRHHGTGRAIYKGPRCSRCSYPVSEPDTLCEDCRLQAAPPKPPERWAVGAFEIQNPSFHGIGL